MHAILDSHEALRAKLAEVEADCADIIARRDQVLDDLRRSLEAEIAARKLVEAKLTVAEAERDEAAVRGRVARYRVEQHVRRLRDCLDALAHPETGWPDTAIADRYEESRIDVPLDLDEAERPGSCVEQMREEWGRQVEAALAERTKELEETRSALINAAKDLNHAFGSNALDLQDFPQLLSRLVRERDEAGAYADSQRARADRAEQSLEHRTLVLGEAIKRWNRLNDEHNKLLHRPGTGTARAEQAEAALARVREALRQSDTTAVPIPRCPCALCELREDLRVALTPVVPELPAESSEPVNSPAQPTSPPAVCLDCGLPYEDFPLDVLMPRPQWLAIHPDESGLLCVACMVRRVSKLRGVTCCRMVFEILP
jgi:hypothetical protein